MPEYENGYKRAVSKRHIGLVLLYGVILLALILVGLIFDRNQKQDSFGSLAGRFDSEISVSHNGQTYHYRENEITNYLLIGMDDDSRDMTGYQSGGQADFLLVLSIDRRSRTITPVMIDRDTMAMVNTYGIFGNPAGARQMQICLAQAFSGSGVTGSENTAKAVTKLLGGVKIDHYIAMDIGGIALLNDALGGVTVTLSDDFTAIDPAMKKGATVHLDGKMAEIFVRSRLNVGDGTNVSRMARQHVYLEALLAALEEKIGGSADEIKEIFGSVSGHVKSDAAQNVIFGDINSYCGYDWQMLHAPQGAHRMGDDGFMQFWPDEQSFQDMIVEIWFD